MFYPVLAYHAISDSRSEVQGYTITRTTFVTQMQYLAENNFEAISLDRYIGYASKTHRSHLGRKNVIITFDDGYLSDYSIAFRTLKTFGLVGNFFVTVSLLGRQGYTTWSQLREMQEEGMSIQSHSLSHVFLSQLSPAEIFSQVWESKKILQEKLNKEVIFLSLPGGRLSRDVIEQAKLAEYKGICTSEPGLNSFRKNTNDVLLLRRFLVNNRVDKKTFKRIVDGDWRVVSRLALLSFVKRGLKKLVGDQYYHTLWSRLKD